MRVVALFILVCALCIRAAVRPSHRAPLIVYVGPESAANSSVGTRGTSIRTDGTYVPGLAPPDVVERVHAVFPLATLVAVNTDDEVANKDTIVEWVARECEAVQRRAQEDCFVLSVHSYAPFASGLDPYEFRRWESAMRKWVRSRPVAEADIVTSELGTVRPTPRATRSPVVPDACEPRARIDCVAPCTWYGFAYGCRAGAFCGYRTKFACEHRPECEMVRGVCRVRANR